MAYRLWNCERKTRAKLEIISAYLGAWFGILARKDFKHVIYIDGFCGPGKYLTGEDGSPVLAARLANETANRYPGFWASLIFVDKDERALAHLKSLDDIKRPQANVRIKMLHGEFAAKVDEIVEYLQKQPGSPTFSFIDPFGFGQSPFGRFRRLMHNEHSELFINLMCGFMNRFKEHQNPDVTAKIKAIIDTDDLTPIIEASDSIDAVCTAFETQLKKVGRYTLKFMMRDENNIRDNAFFFCGRNPKGFEKIKEAMWKIDPENGNSFSSHRQARQQAAQPGLFEKAVQTHRLSQLLLDKFGGRKNVPVSEIFQWVIDETDVFLPRHARRELENLFGRGKLSFSDPDNSSRKRRAGSWPERLLVTFAN